jgi:type IV fimbrial biogenesis protein FimT
MGEYSHKLSKQTAGFTMIELMVVLVVLAVLLGVGVPAFTELIRSNRLTAEVNSLRASLATARSEALVQRSWVTVCQSSNAQDPNTIPVCLDDPGNAPWEDGFVAFVDFDGDGLFDAGDDRRVTTEAVERDPITVRFDNSRVRFDAQGAALGFAGTFTVCDNEREDEDARALIVAPSGQIRSAIDTTSDSIVNGLDGTNVSCP